MRVSRHRQTSGNTTGIAGAIMHVLIVVCGVAGLDVWFIYSVWFK